MYTNPLKLNLMSNEKSNFKIKTTDCSCDIFNCYLVGRHEISSVRFKKLTEGFFGANPPPCYPIAISINDLIKADCTRQSLNYKSRHDKKTNKDITIVIGTYNTSAHEGRYSIQLFRGLFLLFDFDSIEFSKSDNGHKKGVVFKLVKGLNDVYYGDLTTQFPFIGEKNLENPSKMETEAYDCTDMTANLGYTTRHAKTPEEFSLMVKEFYKAEIPKGRTYPISIIDTRLDCNSYCVRFTFDPLIMNNDDISVFMDTMDGTSVSKGDVMVSNGKYSIQVFKGLIHDQSPDTLEFFKAKENGNPTIVFRAFKSTSPVYHGDLTSQFPKD
jgi:hypothetical protein